MGGTTTLAATWTDPGHTGPRGAVYTARPQQARPGQEAGQGPARRQTCTHRPPPGPGGPPSNAQARRPHSLRLPAPPAGRCSPAPGPAATHAEASADPRPQALPAAWQDPRGHRVGSRPEGQAQEPVETHIWGRVGHRCPRGACAHGDSRWQGFPRQGRHASHCGRQTKGPAPRRDHRGERWGQAGSWESLAPGRTPASVTQAGPHRGADAPGQAKGLTPR